MLKQEIGENAGKIWQTLNKSGRMNLIAVKKETALEDKDLYMSLGWLAKEEKIRFEQNKNQILISLTEK